MAKICARVAWLLAVSLPAFAGLQPALAQDAPAVATTPVTELLTRMDGLEAQIARLTAQNEELANRQRQIEARLAPVAAPTPAVTGTPTPDLANQPVVPDAQTVAVARPADGAPSSPKSASASNLQAMSSGAADRTAPGPARASAKRIAAVKAVIKPDTGAPALDEYSYGFRLYTAKLYSEAAQQLKLFIDRFPKDAQISYARNLLGRAYLDDGKPRDAAPWFLTNYKTDPRGRRAADSLLNLGATMRALGDQARACIALTEFAANYAAEAQGRLRADYTRTRAGLTCS